MNSSYGKAWAVCMRVVLRRPRKRVIVYGKVQATAAEKQEALYTLGLCEILEMALFAEEMLVCSVSGRDRTA